MNPLVHKELQYLADHLLPHQREMQPLAAAISVILDGCESVEGWLELNLVNGRDLPSLIERFRPSVLLFADFLSRQEGRNRVSISQVEKELFTELLTRPLNDSKKDPFSTSPVPNSGTSRVTMLRLPILSGLMPSDRVEMSEKMSSTPLFFDEEMAEMMMEYRDSLPEVRLRGAHPPIFPQEQFMSERLIEAFYSYGSAALYCDNHTFDRGAGRNFCRNFGLGLQYDRINLALFGFEPYEVKDMAQLTRLLKQSYGLTPKGCEDIAANPLAYMAEGGDPDKVRVARDCHRLFSGKAKKISTIFECDMPSCGILDGAAIQRNAKFNTMFNMADPEWKHCRHLLMDYACDPLRPGGGIRFLRDRNRAAHGEDLVSFLSRDRHSEEALMKAGMSPVNYGAKAKTAALAFLDMELCPRTKDIRGVEPSIAKVLYDELARRGYDLSSQDGRKAAFKWTERHVAAPFIRDYNSLFPWAPYLHATAMAWYEQDFEAAVSNDGFPSVSVVPWGNAVIVVPHYTESDERTHTIRIPDPNGFGPRAKSKTVQVTKYEEDPSGYATLTKLLFGADGTKMAKCQLDLDKKGYPSFQKFDCVLVGGNALGEVNDSMLKAHRELHGVDVLSELTGHETQGESLDFSDNVVCIRSGECI